LVVLALQLFENSNIISKSSKFWTTSMFAW
jgi:hypothetical protein